MSPWGVRGWMKVHSFTVPQTNILNYKNWWLKVNNTWAEFNLEKHQLNNTQVVIKFSGCDDRNHALQFNQCTIGVLTESLPTLPRDEYYWFQLKELEVVTQNSILLGKIKQVFNAGAPHDIISVEPCHGSIDRQNRLIPYIGSVVQSVDTQTRIMRVDWQADY
jgi:16S rRNA processing protein RimM